MLHDLALLGIGALAGTGLTYWFGHRGVKAAIGDVKAAVAQVAVAVQKKG